MIAVLGREGLRVEDGAIGAVVELGQAYGRDRRTRRMHATRLLRAAGYGDLGSWDEAGTRTVGSAPPPPPDPPKHEPSAPDPDVPAPKVGDIVMPRAGLPWCGKELRVEPSEVVSVHDYRPDGLAECIVVIQPAVVVAHLRAGGHPINPEFGAYVGLVDVTPVDAG